MKELSLEKYGGKFYSFEKAYIILDKDTGEVIKNVKVGRCY